MTKIAIVAALLAASAAVPAQAAVTVGHPAVQAPVTDSCSSCTFVVNKAFGQAGLKLDSFNFYANTTFSIRPLLFTRTDAGSIATFMLVGIGQTRTAALGANTFAFGLSDGTGTTTANSYFGFYYPNAGVVAFSYNAQGEGTFVAPSNYTPAVGAVFSANAGTQIDNAYQALDARTYSINATAVPEPATWAMMLLGFGMVGFGLRARRQGKVTTRVAFG